MGTDRRRYYFPLPLPPLLFQMSSASVIPRQLFQKLLLGSVLFLCSFCSRIVHSNLCYCSKETLTAHRSGPAPSAGPATFLKSPCP